eukprot:s2065_g22.t1
MVSLTWCRRKSGYSAGGARRPNRSMSFLAASKENIGPAGIPHPQSPECQSMQGQMEDMQSRLGRAAEAEAGNAGKGTCAMPIHTGPCRASLSGWKRGRPKLYAVGYFDALLEPQVTYKEELKRHEAIGFHGLWRSDVETKAGRVRQRVQARAGGSTADAVDTSQACASESKQELEAVPQTQWTPVRPVVLQFKKHFLSLSHSVHSVFLANLLSRKDAAFTTSGRSRALIETKQALLELQSL